MSEFLPYLILVVAVTAAKLPVHLLNIPCPGDPRPGFAVGGLAGHRSGPRIVSKIMRN